ncbi:phage baseplate assembly protein V [Halomonas sp. HG01]|uniref:phage baseplate assembly protein V n=1 Tax=Halomonas sp. HG01 TaxID=1609967 RepID=UPI0006145EB6|nr:phage baseplate assembly protein V [Halomonas sp. HG01]
MADQRRAWQRLAGPLWRRIRLLVSRGVLKLVDDSLKLQGVQVTLLGGEPAQAERFQQYGITSHPHPGAEAVVAAVGGARAHLVALAVDDRRYRLKGLARGEMAIYDDQGQKVHLTRSGIVIDGVGKPVNFVNCPDVYMDGNLRVTGDVYDGVSSMQGMRDIYNDHDHAENDSGGPTDPPNQGMN